MASDFADLVGMARSSVEAVLGEAAIILPMDRPSGPNGKRAASVERAPWLVQAIFYREAEAVGRDMANAFSARSANGRGGALRSGQLTASVGRGPNGQIAQVGDLLRRDPDNGERFEITAIDPDGLGQFTLTVAEAAPT
ncbi:MAG: hypothetical protein LCH86_07675 [Proteobacteria bacterium]|nr:hypothetical protein [Pseudomonadota bacterium]